MCAMNISKTSSFLGNQVSCRIIWDKISNRLLLFNIPVGIPLMDIACELEDSNNLHILELRLFIKKKKKVPMKHLLFFLHLWVLPSLMKSKYGFWRSKFSNLLIIHVSFRSATNSVIAHSAATLNCATCVKQHSCPCVDPLLCSNC